MSVDAVPRSVLDATVVAALYLEDRLTPSASVVVGRLLADEVDLHAPQLLVHEVSNACWKAARRDELDADDCFNAVRGVVSSGIRLHPPSELALPAVSLALAHGISAYDAAYLALALKLEATLVTGDAPFARRAEATGVPLELVTA